MNFQYPPVPSRREKAQLKFELLISYSDRKSTLNSIFYRPQTSASARKAPSDERRFAAICVLTPVVFLFVPINFKA
jgi:hypothetical protein